MKILLNLKAFVKNLFKPKFKLGPIQKAWIHSLKTNPHRQLCGQLGLKFADGSYRACCLGEGGLIAGVCGWKGKELVALDSYNKLYANKFILWGSNFEALGLLNSFGGAKTSDFRSLSNLNDEGTSWSEIAKILETYPETYFIKSV